MLYKEFKPTDNKNWKSTYKKIAVFYIFVLLIYAFFAYVCGHDIQRNTLIYTGIGVFFGPLIIISLYIFNIRSLPSIIVTEQGIQSDKIKIAYDEFTTVYCYYDSSAFLFVDLFMLILQIFMMILIKDSIYCIGSYKHCFYFLQNDKVVKEINITAWDYAALNRFLLSLKDKNKTICLDTECPQEIILQKGFIRQRFDDIAIERKEQFWVIISLIIFLVPIFILLLYMLLRKS